MSTWRRRLNRSLIVLAALSIGLLLAEGLTRMFGLAPAVYRLGAAEENSAYEICANPLLGYLLKANYRNEDEPDLHNSFPRTNAHGFRDVERSIEKPPGVRRVIVVGDSVVVGHGIRDLNDTISRELEDLLRPQNIEVLNLAVGGYCSAAEIELLATRGLRYSPDLVILLFTENDYLDWNTLFEVAETDRPEWAETLFIHSALFRWLAITTDLCSFGQAVEPRFFEEKHKEAIEGNNVVGALGRLTALSESGGFKVLVAVWPTFEGGRIADRHVVVDQPDQLFVEVVASHLGLPCIRLSPWFRKDFAQRHGDPEELYTIGDGMHPNERGAEVGARALQAYLAANPHFLSKD